LAVVILGYPFYLLYNQLYFYGKVEAPSFVDTTVVFITLILLAYVLLGKNRLRTLIAASFIFSIINLAQFPVVYFSIVFIYPLTDLQRLFRSAYNQPIGLYIRSFKLTASINDLLNTDSNILDIALGYGFNYEQSYIRAFKRKFGITPGKLRKEGRIQTKEKVI